MKNKTICVFTDFDGTITKKDLGDEVFKEFGKFQPYHDLLKSGKMSISEYWSTVCSELRPEITPADIHQYADECDYDANFKAFADFCAERDIHFSVISDGFDIYIHRVLARAGVPDLPVHSNRMHYVDDKFIPEFPGACESCTCLCASCKRNALLVNAPPDAITVFIGDGYSDFCAAEHADIIFAKKDLAAYCNKNRIPHFPFNTFFEVRQILKKLIDENKIRTRHQAHLKRVNAFETE